MYFEAELIENLRAARGNAEHELVDRAPDATAGDDVRVEYV